MPDRPLFELCVEGLDGLLAAQAGGADRIELCASLLEGGITPSRATVAHALELAQVPIHVMVRPRGGDFLYSEAEFRSMRDDVAAIRAAGAAGVVFGCLTRGGDIDEPRMAALVEAAAGINVTCHRAFDMTRDAEASLEALVRLGVGRVLTSGQRDSALDGAELLARLIARARGRITILICGGLAPENIAEVRRRTGARELHFAALRDEPSDMAWRNPRLGMGGADIEREYRLTVTDPELVQETVRAALA